ncbi:MAG: carboxypeptidase-like regulatory domain-containing protein [Bacteroidota bacterium]
MTRIYCFFFTLIIGISNVWCQDLLIRGTVEDTQGNGIRAVNIQVKGSGKGTTTDQYGNFSLLVDSFPAQLIFTHVAFKRKTKTLQNNEGNLNIILESSTQVLESVEVVGSEPSRNEVSLTKIEPKSAELLPSPFGDFTRILATLPGVVSNNELSSAYSVRGGNFDENLVYVNNIPVYRPFLVTNGQQEGLSFINPNLVENVEFSAGGWQPSYGDALSSVLNVKYKEADDFKTSAMIGLLGGTAHVEGSIGKVSGVLGVRHKSAQYLLNTLETEGQYLPRFTDVQSYINVQLSENTKLGILSSYARNRYLVEPENRETDFGTFNQSLRLFVAFAGREILEYDTYQGGFNLSHDFSDRLRTELIGGAVYAQEREFTDVEGGYRLCDVDNNLASATFNECIVTRGIGTNLDFGRNTLEAQIFNLETRNIYTVNSSTILEFGLGYSHQSIDDVLDEYTFTDSADFVIDIQATSAENEIITDRAHAYAQFTTEIGDKITSTAGIRLNYWSLNKELIISPRWQISYQPNWVRDVLFKAAVGVYAQPSFYRELRDFDGNLNEDLKAQKSLHFIGGLDYKFRWWGRDFNFISELYYKQLWDVIPYEVDNVRLRYYANNDAKAFASGLDLRLSGEFIEGTQSWFSLGILSTRENVENDGNGYIRRPTDQRVNLGIVFQDHIPGDPTLRVNLGVLYGSGLPFGPPNNFSRRSSFNGAEYTRVDIGFSKLFYLKGRNDFDHSIMLTAEVLNMLGASNTISYTWISDVNNQQFAVPNALSARFLNVRATVRL